MFKRDRNHFLMTYLELKDAMQTLFEGVATISDTDAIEGANLPAIQLKIGLPSRQGTAWNNRAQGVSLRILPIVKGAPAQNTQTAHLALFDLVQKVFDPGISPDADMGKGRISAVWSEVEILASVKDDASGEALFSLLIYPK